MCSNEKQFAQTAVKMLREKKANSISYSANMGHVEVALSELVLASLGIALCHLFTKILMGFRV